MITRKRKNPILRKAGGINYEIIDPPIFDEEKLIRKFSEILNRKFRVLANKVPLILFKKMKGIKGFIEFKRLRGTEDDVSSVIIINPDFPNENNYAVKDLFHEVGHFVYNDYISEDAREDFEYYVNNHRKKVELNIFIELLSNYSKEEILEFDSLNYILIESLKFIDEFDYYVNNIRKIKNSFDKSYLIWLKNYSGYKARIFDRPVSSFMPDSEEIFCEIFANYMMYDLRALHSENYRILKQILPELRS